jgi:hypothetical protein
MSTEACVLASVNDALDEGMSTHIIYDKLAQTRECDDVEPQWHKCTLEQIIQSHKNNWLADFCTSAEFLDGLKQGGVAPRRTTTSHSGLLYHL